MVYLFFILKTKKKKLLFERWSSFPKIVWPILECQCENRSVISRTKWVRIIPIMLYLLAWNRPAFQGSSLNQYRNHCHLNHTVIIIKKQIIYSIILTVFSAFHQRALPVLTQRDHRKKITTFYKFWFLGNNVGNWGN